MLLKIFKNRTVSSSGTWGTKNENNYEILNFEFPEELEEYNKRIVYYLGNQKVWDAIIDNKAILTNAITTKGSVKAYIWCTKSDEAFETDVDFRTQIFVMNFFENDNADGIVPTPEQVDGFNTMLTAMNEKIEEIDELETTIENAETQRQENEETRQENESTRQTNEQTRQSQEAERERKTDEAIGNIEDKTAEYNANAEAKTTAFNNNATQKTNEFNSNYTQKVNDFNSNATSKTNDFNSNASSKTTTFNDNAASKTNTFNSNASSKTTDFNTNAENKTSAFNTNASDKTTAFDNNASSKTSDFNTNAESKTNTFNDNATQKTTAFNNNAQAKTEAFDEHTAEITADIEDLQQEVEELSENMPWSTTEQATEINVDNAAKYSKNKLELFGNTEQTQYTGKNLFSGWEEGLINPTTGEEYIYAGRYRSRGYIEIELNTNYYFSMLQPSSAQLFWVYIYKYDENKQYIGRQPLKDGAPQAYENIVNISDTTTKYIRFTEITSVEYINETQFELGTERTSYEPYLDGQSSPSPDFPQPIHVVTGNNTIGVQGKNLFDKNVERKNAFSTGDIGQVVGYGNSSASYSYVNCAKVEANKTYTLSWKIDGIKGATSNRNSKIVDSNNIVLEEFATWINNTTHITFTPKSTGYLVLTTDISSVDIQIEQGSTATSYVPYYHADYPINLGSLELCKIGDYQDYLYKENGNWYKYGAIRKYTQTNAVNFSLRRVRLIPSSDLHDMGTSENPVNLPTSVKINISTSTNSRYNYGWGGLGFVFSQEEMDMIGVENATAFKNYLDANLVAYVVIKPECDYIDITQITDETLISQLEAIYNHLALVKGTNHITITPSDLEPYVTLNYMQDLPIKLDNLDSRLSLLE